MKLKKTFFVALTTIAAALAISTSASAATLGNSPTTDDNPPKTGDNSTVAVAVLATTGVAALGTVVAATNMKKASK